TFSPSAPITSIPFCGTKFVRSRSICCLRCVSIVRAPGGAVGEVGAFSAARCFPHHSLTHRLCHSWHIPSGSPKAWESSGSDLFCSSQGSIGRHVLAACLADTRRHATNRPRWKGVYRGRLALGRCSRSVRGSGVAEEGEAVA